LTVLHSSHRSESHRLRRRHRITRDIVRALVVTAAGVLLVLAFTAYQAMQARTALNDASRHFDELSKAVAAGDTATASDALYAAQKSTLTAQRDTGGPIWWLASKAPIIGDDVTAVRTVTDVVDQVAQGVLPTLVNASATLTASNLQPADGVVKLAGIERLAPLLARANSTLSQDLRRVSALDPASLMSAVSGPVQEAQTKLATITSVAGSASKAAELLPPMLGADGLRTYLVLFQNNAEIRATGGIPGAVATITADHGVIKLGQQGTASSLGHYTRNVLPLTHNEKTLFTDKLGVFPADITFTPNFPRTAQLAQAMWRRATGVTVDGVMSADPVALSYLLGGTGPITLGDSQQLTAANAVQLLLSQVYLDQPNTEKQNAYFADAARRVFEGVVSGQGSAPAVLSGIRKAAAEHRILVWSSDPTEEARLRPTVLSGALPATDSPTPQIGVYLNDGTGSKLDYYLDYHVAVEASSCLPGGAQVLTVDVTMSSKAPSDAASLPVSVVGPGFGAKPGSIRTNVLLYAPAGGAIENPTIDGRPLISAQLVQAGRPVAAQTIDLAPGQSDQLSFQVTTDVNQPGTADVRVTPGLPGSGITTVAPSLCQ
jgi:hypothetical protein